MAKKILANDERRAHSRYAAELTVRFKDRRNLKGEHIRNISQGGIFVCSLDPLPVGEKVQLTLCAPNGSTCKAIGVVVWSIPPEEMTDPDKTPNPTQQTSGMGIRFTKGRGEDDPLSQFIQTVIEAD